VLWLGRSAPPGPPLSNAPRSHRAAAQQAPRVYTAARPIDCTLDEFDARATTVPAAGERAARMKKALDLARSKIELHYIPF